MADKRVTPDVEERADTAFLDRWSRLKQASETEPGASEQLPDTTEEEMPPLSDADMPPIESLSDDSDYSGFLSPEVSEPLRRIALRRLFSSVEFNLRDGLDDYDDDFTDFTKLLDVVTADMRHRFETEAEQEPAAEAAGQNPERHAVTEPGRHRADESGPGERDESGAQAVVAQPQEPEITPQDEDLC